MFEINNNFQCIELSLTNGEEEDKIFKFSNLMNIAQPIINLLKNYKNEIIGIILNKSALLVGVLIGIIKSGNSFIILEQTSIEYILIKIKRFQINKIIFESKKFLKKFEKASKINDLLFYYENEEEKFVNNFGKELIAYAIQTSGSTGEPKNVHVPYSSILPNIEDFIQRFSLNEKSSILFSTSLGFDPSMVELFISLSIGAQLLIPPINILGGICDQILKKRKCFDFIQITPAQLNCLSKVCLNLIFGPDSPIKFLLIGGEIFPLNFVRNYLNSSTKTRIFNVYGITEVSCWASCFEFTHENLRQFSNDYIPIGQPLFKTIFKINEEILLIYGRKCFVNFLRNEEEPTNTGDIAFFTKIKSDNNSKMICVKRRYKPQSQLPSLELEKIILNIFPKIIFSKLLFVDACKFLFLQHIDGNTLINEQEILNKIPKSLWPTRIFWENIYNYINTNGKIDENKLISYIKSTYYNFNSILDFLNKNYNIPNNLTEKNLSTSLKNFGISSLQAVEICFFINNNIFNKNKYFGDKIQFILDENTTLNDFLNYYQKENKTMRLNELLENNYEINNVYIENLEFINSTFLSKECWCIDLGKCIDGAPIYFNGIVYAASHSGIIQGIELNSGSNVFYYCEDDRFESGCVVNKYYIAIGGFSGNLLVFEKTTNQLIRKIKCSSEIRMTPIFDEDNENIIYWGDYYGIIWCLNIKNGNVKQLFNCKNKNFGLLRINPLIIENYLIFGTLNGIIFAINKVTGKLYWKNQLDSPIFAQPIAFFNNLYCIGLSVKGSLNCFEIYNGEKVKRKNISHLNISEHNSTFFDSPALIITPYFNYFLISAGKGNLLLIKYNTLDNQFLLLKQIILPHAMNIVRKPSIFNDEVYVLNTNEELISNNEQTVAHLIIFLNYIETFGHPLILPNNENNEENGNKLRKILIGTRQNLLHCFVFNKNDI
ncbi:AMP-binding domain-containing protein [Meloidogyne graminicola]|uniref:AMP-binding domain-containing protein n=1 Tax=Meloidogyne graminicola TaxID=189291 RepID=A0A8T0A1Q7_9BILA|nr:AMP-binding domain-containing protein [Meloidogyne graminicola]